jgi:broad specificity phosphatase PhoE
MRKIHLIRHGITEAIRSGVYYGSTDVPLNNEGVDQIAALALAGKYPKADGAKLYTTGMLRTEQTFFLIYGCREHQEIPELREYDFGEFEMKTHEQLLENKDYQAWISDRQGLTPCPKGESRLGFQKRIAKGFSKLLEKFSGEENPGGDSILICHGGVIAMIMSRCFPSGKDNIFQWTPEPGRGFTVHMDGMEPIMFEEI